MNGQGTCYNSTVACILEYELSPSDLSVKPNLPPLNYTSFATNFTSKLHSLAGAGFPANVPQKVDRQFFFTGGLMQTNVLKTKPVRDQMDL
ncbi:hypothetical protein NC653_027923 [Populus alba x Populus x berolinensis]|uniref:Uncharacterized protein n=1 Tax=Populus alba x Populus x berolinensis TaxID=444605 RepID=A0AAD6M791_9ROSI|nr:hypothetical protein NC653_027923 [Populus alba x Populus x berolinensis]